MLRKHFVGEWTDLLSTCGCANCRYEFTARPHCHQHLYKTIKGTKQQPLIHRVSRTNNSLLDQNSFILSAGANIHNLQTPTHTTWVSRHMLHTKERLRHERRMDEGMNGSADVVRMEKWTESDDRWLKSTTTKGDNMFIKHRHVRNKETKDKESISNRKGAKEREEEEMGWAEQEKWRAMEGIWEMRKARDDGAVFKKWRRGGKERERDGRRLFQLNGPEHKLCII